MIKKSCKHKDSWLIANGNYLWCQHCGAIRRCKDTGKGRIIYVWSAWLKPNGYMKTLRKWQKLCKRGGEL